MDWEFQITIAKKNEIPTIFGLRRAVIQEKKSQKVINIAKNKRNSDDVGL